MCGRKPWKQLTAMCCFAHKAYSEKDFLKLINNAVFRKTMKI